MVEKVTGPVGEVPVVRIHQSFPLGGQNGAQMVFETYCGQDAEVKVINDIVDKLETVAARQMMKGTVAAKRSQLEQAILQDRNMTRDIRLIEEHYTRKQEADLVRGKRTPQPMSAKEEQDKRTVEQSMLVNRDTIDRLRREIDELLAIIDGEEKLAAE
jgi:hypothetical protein